MTGDTSGVCGQLWATLGVTKVEKCHGAMLWKCRSDVSARLSSLSQVRDGAFLRGGDRVYNVIREGEGQMNCLRRSSEWQTPTRRGDKGQWQSCLGWRAADRTGKSELISLLCWRHHKSNKSPLLPWKWQYSYQMFSLIFYWSKNRFQKPSSAVKAPHCVNIWHKVRGQIIRNDIETWVKHPN